MSDDGSAPVAEYEVMAVRICCPRDDCDGVLLGPNGSTVIVLADGFRPGQVVPCGECGRPFALPTILDELRDHR